MLETFTITTFQKLQGSAFRVVPEGHEPLAFELIEVLGLGTEGAQGREQFSLLFRGPREPLLAQSLWPVEHEELGRLEIFLVPVGPDAEGRQRYEAVFT